MAQGRFTFVNRTGSIVSNHQQDEDLPTIRSHAMREVRRRRGLASRTSAQAMVRMRPSTTVKDGDRIDSSAHASRPQGISWGRAFSGPYCGTAIELDVLPAGVPQQLHYFVYGFTPLTFPTSHIRHECDILRIAMCEGNPALLHALCAVSTIHRALVPGSTILAGSSIAPEDKGEMRRIFLYYKQCAIVLLQTVLSKAVDIQTQSSLATVAMLLMIESLSGDTTTADIHRSGLLELVKRYDGKQKSSDFLVSDMLMSDIKSATSNLSRPSMRPNGKSLSEFDRLKHLPFVPHRPSLTSLGSGFVATKVGRYLGPAWILLMCGMRNLINAVEQNFDMEIGVFDVNGAHFLVLEHQLLSFRSCTKEDSVFRTQLMEGCRIGALLYCNLCLWNWPKNATLIENLLFHLRTAISQWTAESYIPGQLPILLWLYFMGSFAASGAEESRWYLNGMEDVSERLEIRDEDHFRCVLASMFYVDRLMGQHLKDCYIKIFC